MTELTTVPTREIRAALQRVCPGAPIIRLVREPVTRSLERVRFRRADGSRRTVMAKLRGRSGDREVLAYLHLLDPAVTCSPALAGALPESGWLFLDELPGQELSMAAADQVRAAYETLGRIHRRFFGAAERLLLSPAGDALRSSERTAVTASEYRLAFERAEAALAEAGIALPLLAMANAVAERLAATGSTLVHGDFHAGNLRWDGERVYVADWEACAVGTPLHDLAWLEDGHPGAGPPPPGLPRGPLTELALQVYHEAGPLDRLSQDEFRLAQRCARLWEQIRLVALHAKRYVKEARAGIPSGAPEVIREALQAALARAAAAARSLGR
jgi:Ser/Thr protein kinase RdoA (MazF antagonist)